MNIYFSCSITGGRYDQDVYFDIVSALKARGHEVPTEILADENILNIEAVSIAEDVFKRDIAWLDECDAVVAEISTPSHGVGYEIAYALCNGKPVICGYQKGKRVSKMLTGNSHPLIQLSEYSDIDHFIGEVELFMKRIHSA